MAGIKHTKGVLDLTWLDLSSEDQLAEHLKAQVISQMSPSKKKAVLASKDTNQNTQTMNGMDDGSALPPTSPKREAEAVKAVRLSNNLLENMEHLNGPFISAVDTSQILWLDLSFNKFVNVSEAMATTFPNITTIYLHANNISRLSQLKKLKMFPNLKSLSLYGNPVEEHKHYRNYVLNMCPNVTQFDTVHDRYREKEVRSVGANLQAGLEQGGRGEYY